MDLVGGVRRVVTVTPRAASMGPEDGEGVRQAVFASAVVSSTSAKRFADNT